ncbi:MAG TPA: hypothetical protein ENK28_11160 [Aliiroseovarius sp.]|nr:hypothetical protein [Aliiroseovarius sp.]
MDKTLKMTHFFRPKDGFHRLQGAFTLPIYAEKPERIIRPAKIWDREADAFGVGFPQHRQRKDFEYG